MAWTTWLQELVQAQRGNACELKLPDGFLDKPAAPATLVQRVRTLLHA